MDIIETIIIGQDNPQYSAILLLSLYLLYKCVIAFITVNITYELPYLIVLVSFIVLRVLDDVERYKYLLYAAYLPISNIGIIEIVIISVLSYVNVYNFIEVTEVFYMRNIKYLAELKLVPWFSPPLVLMYVYVIVSDPGNFEYIVNRIIAIRLLAPDEQL